MAMRSITELTPEMERFLDWLCMGDERVAGESQNQFAKRIGVSQSALTRWKSHGVFRKAWDARMRATHAAPDLLSDQLKALQDIAADDVLARPGERIKAIETYWKLLGQNSPDRVEVDDKRDSSEMSDEELTAKLESGLQGLRAV